MTDFPPERSGEADYSKSYIVALANAISSPIYVLVRAQQPTKSPLVWEKHLHSDVKLIHILNPNNVIDRNLGYLKLLYQVLKIRPDLLHFSYGPSNHYGGRMGEPLLFIFIFLKMARIPVIVTLHSKWLPKEVEEHAKDLGHNILFAKLAKMYFISFTKIFTQLIDKLLLVTTVENNPINDAFIQSYNLPKNKVEEELHGCHFFPIDENQISLSKEKIGFHGKGIIFSFGFIREDKGFEYLIRSFSSISHRLTNYHLIIAGSTKTAEDRTYLNSLFDLRKELGLEERIHLETSYLTQDEMMYYIDAADVIVFPYTRNVGPSGPLHYAISRGKPVIATKVGYFATMKGIIMLVDPNDSTALADAILSFCTNKDMYLQVKNRELKYAETHDWSRVVRLNLNIYRDVIKNKNLGYN